MAIVTTKGLEGDQAVYSPCILSGTCSRDPQGYTRSLTSYGNTSGYLAVGFASGGATFENNDTVVISGATGDLAKYNGRHTVYSVTGTSIRTNTAWTGGTTAAVGSVLRANDSMMVRLDVYNAASALVSQVYVPPVAGAFSVDMAKTLQTLVSSIFTLTDGTINVANAAQAYTIKPYEQWLGINYETVEVASAGYNQAGVAHRTTSVASIDTTALLNTSFAASGKLLIHAMTSLTGADVEFQFTSVSKTASTMTEVRMAAVNKHVAAVYAIPTDAIYVTVLLRNNTTKVAIKDTLTVRNPRNYCGTRLYFLNKLGGYTSIEFPEKRFLTATEKVDRYTTKSYAKQELTSVIEALTKAEYFKDLADSPEVYDENGVQVELLTSEVEYYSESVQITVEVRREQSFIS